MFHFLSCPRISRVEESALRALREKLFAHSSALLSEFKKYDADKTGKKKVKDSERKEPSQKISVSQQLANKYLLNDYKTKSLGRHQWRTTVIPPTWEGEIGKITV
jgi:serine/threonine-protein phosphatase with EF-hand domain